MNKEDFLYHIPKNWKWKQVKEISEKIHYGYTAKAKKEKVGPKYLRITDIRENKVNWDKVPYCSIEESEKYKYLLNPGDLVFARTGSIGNSYLLGEKIPEAIFASYLIRVILKKEVIKKYVFYYFHSPFYWKQIFETKIGAVQQNVNATKLGDLYIPIAPIKEQELIVKKVDQLFSRLESCLKSLKKTQTLLNHYRQSLLKAAMEGKLTKKWREKHQHELEPASVLLERILKERREKWEAEQLAKFKAKGKMPKDDNWKKKYKEPFKPERINNLPFGWVWATVDQIAERVRYGTSAKSSTDASGIPVLRMGNIVDGELSFENLKYLPQNHHEFPELLLEDRDLVFNRTNSFELVGKTALYKGVPKLCSFASYLIQVRTNKNFFSELLVYYINSVFGRLWIKSVVTQQVGQANVNGTKLRALNIPLPSFKEQQIIVNEVESQLSIVKNKINEINKSILLSNRLKQSILKKAFEGKLVIVEETSKLTSNNQYQKISKLKLKPIDEIKQTNLGDFIE